jgi:nucleotide-binding universal stress UspA family protein
LKKQEAEGYLKRLATRLKEVGLEVEYALQEGFPAETIIQHANLAGAGLILISTHGSSGLSGWNVSSVVQKIILRANKSIVLVRAYRSPGEDVVQIPYQHIFVGLDVSPRAELILPVAIRLAQHYGARLTLGTVIQKTELISRLPLSQEDEAVVARVTQWNCEAARRYLEQVREQYSPAGIEINTRLETSSNMLASLHTMVADEGADLVMLVAHGHSAAGRWPYGSVTTNFIVFGDTTLFIMQDLSADEFQPTTAEKAMLEIQGH